jgi:tRNA(fMet)-specific endonuclease VapC
MTSSSFLLDTDIASYLFRGGNRALDEKIRHTRRADIFISVITQAEILYGVKHFPNRDPRREEVYWFLQLAQVLDWNGGAAEAYADIRYRLTTAAQPIGELDMMIAAHALSLDAVLVSNNTRHYERLSPPLRIENWTEG